jgi:putative membrane protein
VLFTTLKFVHLVGLLILFSASSAKNLLISQTPIQRRSIQLCRTADRASGAAAGLVVVTGLGLLYFSPRGSSFYTHNSLFWLKIFVLILASALLIRTKLFFRKQSGAAPSISVDVPGSMSKILKFDLVSLLVITYLAVLVVNGIGLRLS